MDSLSKKNIVLGAGISGRSAFQLLEKLQKAPLLVDSKEGLADTEENALLHLDPSQVESIVKSPGISPQHIWLQIAKQKNIPIVSEIQLARRYFQGKIVGITGTDGKSTTTSLVHHLLSSQINDAELGGNIGRAFSEFCQNSSTIAALELSSYQLEDSDNLHLNASALLNIATDHLERHGSMDSYIKAKCKIIDKKNKNHSFFTTLKTWENISDYLTDLDCKIHILENQENLSNESTPPQGSKFTKINFQEKFILTPNGKYFFGKFKLQGNHNIENLGIAIMIAEEMGIEMENIQTAISQFQGLSHRFESFYQIQNWNFINDSKATNLHSLMAWLKDYPFAQKKLILLIGGRPKTEPIDCLFPIFNEFNGSVFVYGEASKVWKNDLIGFQDRIQFVEKIEEALIHIKSTFQKEGDKAYDVILSPACASFDQFKNFEERGNHFKDYVRTLFL
jgi:UDP-N-acetylmuramoylalanine--D-glutamate ligase